jgi:hypothetical protein
MTRTYVHSQCVRDVYIRNIDDVDIVSWVRDNSNLDLIHPQNTMAGRSAPSNPARRIASRHIIALSYSVAVKRRLSSTHISSSNLGFRYVLVLAKL